MNFNSSRIRPEIIQ